MKNVWAYTRKSRHLGDPDDPHLFSHHLTVLHRLAAQDGVTIPPENIRLEVGSGESIAGRPTFADMLCEWEALPAGSGGIVYVVEPSRLSRGSNAERGRILDALIRAQIIVASPERRWDPTNPSDELTWSLVQAVDRSELVRYKQRVAIRRAEMTRLGEVITGKAPFGYVWEKSPGQVDGRRVPGQLAPDPDRFPLLVRCCQEVLTVSIQRLARKYGISRSALQDALSNPVICGYPARRYRRRREDWIWPEQPGDYPPACTRAEWEQIQLALDSRSRRRAKTGHPLDNAWCREVVQFVDCPGPVKLTTCPATKRTHPIYQCHPPFGPPLYVHRAAVHEVATEAIAALCRLPDFLPRALALLERERQTPPAAGPDPEEVRRRLNRERERYQALISQSADPDLDEEKRLALAGAERECRRRLDRLKAELAERLTPEPALPALAHIEAPLGLLCRQFEPFWERMGGEEKQEIVVALVNSIPVRVERTRIGCAFKREVGPVMYREWVKRAFAE